MHLITAVHTGLAPGNDFPLILRRHLSAVASSAISTKQYPRAPLGEETLFNVRIKQQKKEPLLVDFVLTLSSCCV